MKVLTIIISILALVSLFSTLTCGLWINKQPVVDPSSITFHLRIGVISVVLVVVSIILLIIKK